jgi:hypothetical protein
MDLNRPEFSYVLMVIPTLFALAVIAQGISKLNKSEPDGSIALGFGIVLLVLIVGAYYFFIV